MMKKALLTFLFLFFAVSVFAQQSGFWGMVHHFLVKPANVDTSYIYQPKSRFSLGVFSLEQKIGFDAHVNFVLTGMQNTKGVSNTHLSENLYKKLGLEVGYGNFSLGYGLEVGPRSAPKRRGFSLGKLGHNWGIRFSYYMINDYFAGDYTIELLEDGTQIRHRDFVSVELATLKTFSVDGYYVFNHKRLAYPSAYKVGMVQRKTAGSWIVAARYMQGSLYNPPDKMLDTLCMLDCYSTMQASIGGGYSVNFVLWHKDPTGPNNKGLRNLTLNLTAMPMLTLFNYLRTSAYQYDSENNHSGEKISKVLCNPVPNYIGNAAVSMSLGRWYLTVQFTYNRFFFRSRDAIDASLLLLPDAVDDITFRGTFHDWSLKGMVAYRF